MSSIKSGSVIDADTAELIRAEYLATKQSIRELSEKYEVNFLALKQRAVYGKWNDERGRAILNTQLLKGARKFTLSKDSLKAKSDSFIERMQENAATTLDILESIKCPKEWDKLALREQVMSALQKRGWAAFGLSDSIQERHVTLHLAGEVSPIQPGQLTDQVVDVEVETVQPQDTVQPDPAKPQ